MRIGVPTEIASGEQRVALVPEIVQKLTSAGHEVLVERGAGVGASFTDDAFSAAGATLVSRDDAFAADVVVKVAPPSADEVAALRADAVLIGFLAPLTDQDGVARLRSRGVTGFAMEAIPRITRAQAMDALSSQATVSGYKSVLLASEGLP